MLAGAFLTACGARAVSGDATRGAERFSRLPCAGCHGAMAQGQFGPPLAGTSLTFEEVRRQVRSPRDQMPAFDESTVSDRDLRDIYRWLTSLKPPTPTAQVTLPAAEATAQARDRFFPLFNAQAVRARMETLDEAALRVEGTIVAVDEQGRYTEVRLQMADNGQNLEVLGLYDTGLSRQAFPAKVGERVTLYGIGTDPVETTGAGGTQQRLPRLQILHVAK